MKFILTAAIFLLKFSFVSGQISNEEIFFETKSKIHSYYVQLNNSDAHVFEMGSYLDKAGSGPAIRSKDTLTKQPDGSNVLYAGKRAKIIIENEKLYLLIQTTPNKKVSKYILDTVGNTELVHTNLNNAYYLGNFFAMCDDLNKTYPLNHYSFRNGFYSWKGLNNKNIKHSDFTAITDIKLKAIKDSIAELQNQYTSLTNTLIQNIKTIDYNSLKDGLTKLPAEDRSTSQYFDTVIEEISIYRPEFFFKLAEDFPDKRHAIFWAVEDDKQVIKNLKAVEGHAEIKKKFFKERKFHKSAPYMAIIPYAALIGLVTLLVVTQ